ncbi:zinc-binding alcohol dehydrogenase [Enterococcus haemoperoxidus ATCC BAA-382]|uniref:Zinc-type alcohol dehydrogenase-like protein n=1 Tax=Enterococcus haemoperoxidus ATCC BAA-382 TaxID=1158608 RepID=R2SGY7_9ENTE|nr:zinc-binding alcohol dehydrogenase family protein [Enterococcus haemoperoxidus]EOH94565.1 zinc-binding alcohol dehydrogenase [Enterococcus haemoperoxidus ATCC BAA-382]EOT60610.1 zinc-binding alcohol dehydrogenase [Enterococcus haemoperoxidus ATCC BAA-382]OJG52827.1 zinc-binding alcohol dehydrogenase [Enterococcus haemoperoxidus]
MNENKQMKAVGFFEGLPIKNEASFMDEYKTIPLPGPQDILVKVKAVSINPVDTKLRQAAKKQTQLTVLGFDGVGEVVSVGENVSKFTTGDRVFYAGTTKRAGSNQEFQLVNEGIAALAPKNLSDEEAAALPLTSLTAYELLFDKFGLIPKENANQGKTILVINGAGGVGSILNQLAHWAGLTVYATASPANFDWLKKLGVDYPIDYHQDLKQSLEKLGIHTVDYAAVLFNILPYFNDISELIAPFGHIGTIVGLDGNLDISQLKNRSVSFDWEYMFAKTDFNDQIETQGAALSLIAQLAEAGKIVATVGKAYTDGINAANLKKATEDVESGHMRGKVIVSGLFNGQPE